MAMGLSMPVALMHTLTKIGTYCGMYCFEDWGSYSSQRRAYGTIVLSVQFIIPLSIIIICYTAISVRLGQVNFFFVKFFQSLIFEVVNFLQ